MIESPFDENLPSKSILTGKLRLESRGLEADEIIRKRSWHPVNLQLKWRGSDFVSLQSRTDKTIESNRYFCNSFNRATLSLFQPARSDSNRGVQKQTKLFARDTATRWIYS